MGGRPDMAKTTIGQLASDVGFKGTSQHRITEPQKVQNLSIVDNSLPGKPTIRTSIDCYVSGQYIQKGGKMIEVTQRYTIFVSYSTQTLTATMSQARERIVGDFEARYGRTFNVSSVYVPGLPVPKDEREDRQPMELYGGSQLFKEMTRYEKMRYDIGTEKLKADTNIRSVKSRYGFR